MSARFDDGGGDRGRRRIPLRYWPLEHGVVEQLARALAEHVVSVQSALGVVMSYRCGQLVADLLAVGAHLREDLLLLTDVGRQAARTLLLLRVVRRRHSAVSLAIRRL